jgi:hypothetical protein
MRPWKDCQCFSEIFASTLAPAPQLAGVGPAGQLPNCPGLMVIIYYMTFILSVKSPVAAIPHWGTIMMANRQTRRFPGRPRLGTASLGWIFIGTRRSGKADTPGRPQRPGFSQGARLQPGIAPGQSTLSVPRRTLEKIKAWSILPGRHTW